jgi:hypothetical protein
MDMNKNLPYYIAGASLVVALFCLATVVKTSGKRAAVEAEAQALRDQIARMKAYVPGADANTNRIAAYRSGSIDTNDVATLQALLAEQDAELAVLKASREERRDNRQPRESFEDRMARMKTEDPEGYAEMIKRREEQQSKMRYNLAERTATFMDLDTSTMTEEERANHDLLVQKMANVWELTEKFQDPEAPPDREAMRELFTQMNEVRPLMQQERTVMFKQLGAEAGYQGEDAEAFASYIEGIIDATSLRMPYGGRGGPGGSRDGRGGSDRGGGGDRGGQ